MDHAKLKRFVDRIWDDEILPQLIEYIRIPNKSPAFDPDWAEHGYMDKAVALMERWARGKLARMPGATLEVVRLPGRTPLILIEIPGGGAERRCCSTAISTSSRRWSAGPRASAPGRPVLQGRQALWPRRRRRRLRDLRRADGDRGAPRAGHPPCAAAWSSSRPARSPAASTCPTTSITWQRASAARRSSSASIRGCGNYDQLWLTTSLRGTAAGDAHRAGADRGRAFRRRLGRRALELPHPPPAALAPRGRGDRRDPAARSSMSRCRPNASPRPASPRRRWASEVHAKFPFAGGTTADGRRSRRAACSTGPGGRSSPSPASRACRAPANAGNVLLPFTTAKLSLRLPPTLDGAEAKAAVVEAAAGESAARRRGQLRDRRTSTDRLERAGAGALARAVAGRGVRGRIRPAAGLYGRGRHHPLHGHAGREVPARRSSSSPACSGPHSNAHGPNEFLHIPTAKHLTAVIARVLADHRARR